MSLQPSVAKDVYVTTRLACQLTREPAGRYLLIDELALDACTVVAIAILLREAIARGLPYKLYREPIEDILDKYDAQLIVHRNPKAMVVGVRFRSGSFANAFTNTLYVV